MVEETKGTENTEVDTPAGEAAEKARAVRSGWVYLGLLAIFGLFLYLRFRSAGALLGWDEAQLALTVKSYSGGLKDVWASLSHVHPPLYLWLMVVVTKVFGASAAVFKTVSILFSLGTLWLTFQLAKELFDEKVALLSALFLAVMQGAVVMDTWIKQDPMTGFFIVATVLLFVRGSWKSAGFVFGLGMLTKETAVFALVAILLYAIASWKWEKVRHAIYVGLIGAVMSFWWYLWFSTSVGHFWDFFARGSTEGPLFKKPFWFYFQGLPRDVGWVLLGLLVLGAVLCAYRFIKDNRAEYALPVLWFLSVYCILSISVGKPYWMIPPAFSAIAMLAGVGAAGILSLVRSAVKNERAATAVQAGLVVALVAGLVFTSVTTGYLAYNRARHKEYWDYAAGVRADALFLKKRAGEQPVLFILDEKQMNRDPILTWYLGDTPEVSLSSQALAEPKKLVDDYALRYGTDWIYIRNREDTESVRSFLDGLRQTVAYRIPRNTQWGTVVELVW